MSSSVLPAESSIQALVGHRFPGGSYTVEHWENVLLTGCTGAELMPAGHVHPIILFHMPIQGAGTSIAEMFALGQAESDLSILIESYEWEFLAEIEESVSYEIAGGIQSAERCRNEAGKLYDRLQYWFEVSHPENGPVARSVITWHYTRNTL